MLEGMLGGRETILFYLKLLLESIETEGRLRVNERVAHTAETLAMITHTDWETVEKALEQLERFGLLETLEDQTILLPGIEDMIGSETDSAVRMRNKRDHDKSVTLCKNVTQSKSIEKEIEKEIDADVEDGGGNNPHRLQCMGGRLGKGVIFLTEEQDEKLLDLMGLDAYDKYVEKLADFIIRNDAKVANHYQTILKWYQEDCQ